MSKRIETFPVLHGLILKYISFKSINHICLRIKICSKLQSFLTSKYHLRGKGKCRHFVLGLVNGGQERSLIFSLYIVYTNRARKKVLEQLQWCFHMRANLLKHLPNCPIGSEILSLAQFTKKKKKFKIVLHTRRPHHTHRRTNDNDIWLFLLEDIYFMITPYGV